MKKIIAAIVAVLMCTLSAMAGLEGTTMNVSIVHDQYTPFSSLTNATYTYGESAIFTVPNWGSIGMMSPAAAPGLQNAIHVDFTNFSYSAFVAPFPATGTIMLNNIAESADVASVKILVNGLDVATTVAATATGFQASWLAASVFNANPVMPSLTVAWNTIPGSGPLALLGLAGFIAGTRRRR